MNAYKKHVLIVLVCLGIILPIPAVFASSPTGITVDTDADEIAADGYCSLREAIRNANQDTQVDNTDCKAGSGADTISFSGNYTINLDDVGSGEEDALTGDLDIKDDVTIIGKGAELTVIDASGLDSGSTGNGDRIFHVHSGITVYLTDMTLRGVNATSIKGGAIYNDASTVSLTNSNVTNNTVYQGGALYSTSSGTVSVSDCTISNNVASNGGGGFFTSNNTVTLKDTTISGNESTAGHGGGLYISSASSTLTFNMSQTLISGNTAKLFGGGIYVAGSVSVVEITNSTVTVNSATSGAGINNVGVMSLYNVTIAYNAASNEGGGIYTTKAIKYSNSLIAENTTSGSYPDCRGTMSGMQGYNIVQDTSGCTLSGVTTGNQTGMTDEDLGLASALADNGGSTQTLALTSGSVAIDRASPLCMDATGIPLTSDQRGSSYTRTFDGDGDHLSICDVGAFEFIGEVNCSDTIDDDGDGDTDCDDDECSTDSHCIDNDSDGFIATMDCDDNDSSVYPGADEYCDSKDNNCDGMTDELTAVDVKTWYIDMDHDGYGDSSAPLTECDQPTGTSAVGGDCSDMEPDAYPGATEICDLVDNDCDGSIDEDATDAKTYYADSDSDGFGDPATSSTSCTPTPGYVTDNTDCDDSTGLVSPAAPEILCDGLDNDCEGTVDNNYTCSGSSHVDDDGDGMTEEAGDCNDTDTEINPSASDDDCDGVDDNCDGSYDEDNPNANTPYYLDSDGDGYGDNEHLEKACSQPSGYVSDHTDCDDGNASVHPGNTETCDSIDNDCDGDVDEEGVCPTGDDDENNDISSDIGASDSPVGDAGSTGIGDGTEGSGSDEGVADGEVGDGANDANPIAGSSGCACSFATSSQSSTSLMTLFVLLALSVLLIVKFLRRGPKTHLY